MESIGFGSRAIRDGTLEDACLDEVETTVTVAEDLAGGWYIVRSMHM